MVGRLRPRIIVLPFRRRLRYVLSPTTRDVYIYVRPVASGWDSK